MNFDDLSPEQSFVLGELTGMAARFGEQSKKGDYAGLSATSEEWSVTRRRARELGIPDEMVASHCRQGLTVSLRRTT